MLRSYSVAVAAAWSVACGAVVVPPQEGRDGGALDGAIEDAGHRDAGAPTDGGSPDAGIGRDGGARDGGVERDAGERDAGPPRDGGPARDAGPAMYELSVSVLGAGPGRVTSSPAGIDCGTSCVGTFSEGTSVALGIDADPASRFVGWGGACAGQAPCVVIVNADTTVTAELDVEPSLGLGTGHSCAINAEGRLRCWGSGVAGCLGHDNEVGVGVMSGVSIQSAGDIIVGDSVVQVAAGAFHTCAVTKSRSVRCWGANSQGQLGYGHVANVSDGLGPTIVQAGDVAVGASVAKIVAGWEHTCVLLDSGAVRCWGRASEGQLGYDDTTRVGDDSGPSIIAAGDVPVGFSAIDICAGQFHNCAVSTTGRVRCWGHGLEGQLGQGSTTRIGDGTGPSIIAAGDLTLPSPAVRAIECGTTHTCATDTANNVRCWGAGADGQLGYNDTLNVADGTGLTIPQAGYVPIGAMVAKAYPGGAHTCARTLVGGVRCWGSGLAGRLGYGATTNVGDDVSRSIMNAGDVPIGTSVRELYVGTGAHSCVITQLGTVRCWGTNGTGYSMSGSIGDGVGPSIIQAGDVPVW